MLRLGRGICCNGHDARGHRGSFDWLRDISDEVVGVWVDCDAESLNDVPADKAMGSWCPEHGSFEGVPVGQGEADKMCTL